MYSSATTSQTLRKRQLLLQKKLSGFVVMQLICVLFIYFVRFLCAVSATKRVFYMGPLSVENYTSSTSFQWKITPRRLHFTSTVDFILF